MSHKKKDADTELKATVLVVFARMDFFASDRSSVLILVLSGAALAVRSRGCAMCVAVGCVLAGMLRAAPQDIRLLMRRATSAAAGVVRAEVDAPLPQTSNPLFKPTSEQPEGRGKVARAAALPPAAPPRSTIRHPDYTPSAVQRRLDERQFRKVAHTQSTTQRARMLDDMYRELLETSRKADPYLLAPGVADSDGCQPARVRTQ